MLNPQWILLAPKSRSQSSAKKRGAPPPFLRLRPADEVEQGDLSGVESEAS